MKSASPRKQRKIRYDADLSLLRKFLGSNLSKELREKLGKRTLSLRKGDKVKIMRGQFKGKEGAVERVDVKHTKVYVQNIEVQKKDGSKAFYPMNPSNLMIVETVEDKMRIKNGKTTPKKTSSQ